MKITHIRSRIKHLNTGVPVFKIADEVLKSKSILSCEVVYTKDKYVAHVEFLPGSSNQEQTLSAAKKRCEKKYGNAVSGKLLFRIHSSSESFKLTGSGKRDIKALINEGEKKRFQSERKRSCFIHPDKTTMLNAK